MADRKIDGNDGAGNVDLIRRIDAMQACQVGPSDEWAKATKDGYNQAATDCAMAVLRVAPVSAANDEMTIPESETDYCIGLRAQLAAMTAERDELASAIDSIETNHGLTDNGNLWRFWAKTAREIAAKNTTLAAQLAAANARADQAWDAALGEALAACSGVYDGALYLAPHAALATNNIYSAILALLDKPAPAVTVEEAAKVLLAVHDGFMNGEPYDKTEADRLFLAASFGAQAFAVCPQPEARPSAMLRAFLLALIDPTDPQLDYLRAKNVVRAIAASEA